MSDLYLDIDDVIFDTAGEVARRINAIGLEIKRSDFRVHPSRDGWLSLGHKGVDDEWLTPLYTRVIDEGGLPLIPGFMRALQILRSYFPAVRFISARAPSLRERTELELRALSLVEERDTVICTGGSEAKLSWIPSGATLVDDWPHIRAEHIRHVLFSRPWNASIPHSRRLATWTQQDLGILTSREEQP